MIEVLEPSLLMTIQDMGRHGFQALGVPASGAMDAFALRAGNLLVCNPVNAAAVEIGFSSATFRARNSCVIALTGVGFSLHVDGFQFPLWTSIYVRINCLIQVKKIGQGNFGYLVVHGGFQSPPVLGSRSTYLLARLGKDAPARHQTGDILAIGRPNHSLIDLAGTRVAVLSDSVGVDNRMVNYTSEPLVEVIPGPQAMDFTSAGIQTFYSSSFSLSRVSDRTGYRLDGPIVEQHSQGELISEGMVRGCIQVPPGGQPIIMQADCPPTGGYPKIATVTLADQPLVAQVPLGEGHIRFAETTVEKAQQRYRALMKTLAESIIRPEFDDYSW